MRIRILLGGLAVVGFVLAIPAPASAGGSLLEFDRFAYQPGDIAVAEGSFGKGCCGRGLPKDGPFYVYAHPSRAPYICDEPCVPKGAIRVGVIEVSGDGPTWHGRVEFVVPDLAPGTYGIWHCNDPCGTGLGDVVFWELRVVESDVEARLWSKLDRLEQKLSTGKWNNRSRLQQLERRVRRQILDLEAHVTQLETRPVANRKVQQGISMPWAKAVVTLGLAAAAAGLIRTRLKARSS
jgi:hypothetical protein